MSEYGIMPGYDLPGVRIQERVSGREIYLTLEIENWKAFIEKINSIQNGGSTDIVRYQTMKERQIWIRVINRDTGEGFSPRRL